jgi:transcriptional regulator with XRE-family HTH domain
MVTDHARRVGETVKALRVANSLTQEEIASAINLKKSTFSRMERGEFEITLSRLVELADFFGVTVVSLIDGTASGAAPKVRIRSSVACEKHGTLAADLAVEDARILRAQHLRDHLAGGS